MGRVRILEETIKNPLTFMGECAGIAYDSDTTDAEKNRKRGLNCVTAGHGRMWEFCDVYVEISGYSARFARELMRHVGDGLTVIQRSTRYVDESSFGYSNNNYYTPKSILNNPEAKEIYDDAMEAIDMAYMDLVNMIGIPKEDAANLLPLGLNTVLVMKHNARTWIQMAETRLCTRTYEEFREFMKDFIIALGKYSSEWEQITKEFFKCKCEKCGCCEEEYSCGKRPKKDEVAFIDIKELEKISENQYEALSGIEDLIVDYEKSQNNLTSQQLLAKVIVGI